MSPAPSGLPVPTDPPVSRAALMTAAFGANVAGAGVFDADELPHGATPLGGNIYFVVFAPHAVSLQLVLLTPAGRVTHDMQPTLDNQYWWCARPAAEIAHGQRYRFLQNDDVEVLDPASRWVDDPASELWAQVGEGAGRAWSLYLDQTVVSALIPPGFRTLPWEDLVIYELHAQRFTVRNAGVTDGLDQVAKELAPGGYLARLGVTALEFLPLHEFSKGSWGYNPSLFFAIDSTFGGPEALARVVSAAHGVGKGLMMDVVFNHLQESPLQAIAKDVYVDGDTAWGDEINYDHPACMRFLRQALVYLWRTFQVDGFRFDSTLAIINGQWKIDGVINTPGSGGGWALLGYLRAAVRRPADAEGRAWPYFVGENDPNDWAITNNSNGGVLDGQWHFAMHYPLDDASQEKADDTSSILGQMALPHIWLRPFSEAVRYAESHDSCGHREDWRLRVAKRAPFGRGFQTAKAAGTVALLAHGVPMLFMGQEGGEDEDFFFDYNPATDRGDLRFFARLPFYDDLGNERNRILAWYRDLIGLRTNAGNGLRGNDAQTLGAGNRTVAFSRAGGRYFVIATFGTPDTRQSLAWLQLPNGGQTYKEIFNSSWPAYGVEGELNFSNGSYDAALTGASVVNLPPVGGIVLERR